MVFGMSNSNEIPLNHADNVSTVFVWTHRSVDLVAVGIFLVLFNMCRSLLDQIQHLLSLVISIHKVSWLELLAYLLCLTLLGSHHCDDIYPFGQHACRRGSGAKYCRVLESK
jgi:hypothetical protein